MILDRRRLRRSKSGWEWVRPPKNTNGDADTWTSLIPRPIAGLNRAVATGFLVSPNLLMTAGHCVRGGSCFTGSLKAEQMAFVFDLTESWFHLERSPAFSDAQVYFGSSLLAGEFNARFMDIPDWAVIKLDRPPAQARTRYLPATNTAGENELSMVGHPDGRLQMCWSGRKINSEPVVGAPFCLLETPALPGASGSPVLNRQERLVGILAGTASDAAIKTMAAQVLVKGATTVSRFTPGSVFRDWLSQ